MWRRFAAVLGFVAFSSHGLADELRILAESPIAITTVGYFPESGKYAQRVITVGIALPSAMPPSDFSALDYCVQNSAETIGYQLRVDLGLTQDDAFPDSQAKMQSLATVANDIAAQGDVTAATYNSELNRRAALIGNLLVGQRDKVLGILANACGQRHVDPVKAAIEVAFNVRACPADTALCRSLQTNKTWAFAPSQFDKVYGLMTVAKPRQLNQWLTAKASAAAKTSADGLSESANLSMKDIEIESAKVTIDLPWPKPPTAQQQMDQLQAYVNKLHEASASLRARVRDVRAKSERLSYLAPAILGLSKQNLTQIVDLVEHPFAASLLLPPTGAQVFTIISDEVARSRIMDCARLRGTLNANGTDGGPPPLEAIGKCAGVKLDEAKLVQCLNTLQCLPERDAKAVAAVLTLSSASSIAELAANTSLPRVGRAMQKFEDLEALGNKCGTDHQDDQWAATDCMLKGSMLPGDYAVVDCVKSAQHPSVNGDRLLDCASGLLRSEDKATLSCFRKYHDSPSSALGCAALGRGSKDLQDAYACLHNIKSSDSAEKRLGACLPLVPGLSANDQNKIACFAAADTNTKRMFCLVSKDEIPPDAQNILDCVQSSSDWKKFAGCAVAKKLALKGQFGQAVGCAMTNGGANLGAAICMANLQGHLTEDQLIVLQCASSSPDLSTFAVCAGGQMVVGQLVKCRHEHVGADGCFGSSNEIRRFLKAIKFDFLREGSPVAQLLDLQIDVVWFEYSLAEKGVQAISDFVSRVGESLQKLGDALTKAGSDLLNGAGDAISNVLDGALGVKW
jgi:hypothetical protein